MNFFRGGERVGSANKKKEIENASSTGKRYCIVGYIVRSIKDIGKGFSALTASLKNKPITLLLCTWRLMKGNDGQSIRHSVRGWKLYCQRMFWTKYDSKSLVEWLNLNGLPPTVCDVIEG